MADYRVMELTENEKIVLGFIEEEFKKNNLDFSLIQLEKYGVLELMIGYSTICRIKLGPKVYRFSIAAHYLPGEIKSDKRFAEFRGKVFWKINLKDMNDSKNYIYLIVEAYKSAIQERRTLYYKVNKEGLITEIQKNKISVNAEIYDGIHIEVNDIFNVDPEYLRQCVLEDWTFVNEFIEEGDWAENERPDFFSITLIKTDEKKVINSDSQSTSFTLGTTIRENISDYTVIDIETTGKYVNNCEIIELSAVRVRNSQIVDKYSTLIKPEKKVPAEITELTGITDEMLENAPLISKKLSEYIAFIGDDIILGHNIASFDRHIISRYCSELGLPLLENDTLDTLQYAHCCDVDVPDYRLTTLTAFFGISHSNAHRALADCIANFECYEKLKGRFDGVYRSSPFNQSRERVEVDKSVLSEVTEKIDLSGKSVCLTGAFNRGSRSSVQKEIENLGAVVVKDVSSKTDYLIVGGSGSADWKFGNYGGKVQKALEYQEKGKNIKIVSEEDVFSSEKSSSTLTHSAFEPEKPKISVKDLFDNSDTGTHTTDVKEYIEQLDKKIMSEYNTPENFVKYFENSGNSSIYLVEPAMNKKSQLVMNYCFKKFKGETIRYHSFAVKKSVIDFITIPENAEIRDVESNELNTYINFQTFDENTMNFIKSVVEYYVIHFEPKDKFGCCSKYKECSVTGECVHDNKFYSKACWYRKNLESGNIFY